MSNTIHAEHIIQKNLPSRKIHRSLFGAEFDKRKQSMEKQLSFSKKHIIEYLTELKSTTEYINKNLVQKDLENYLKNTLTKLG